MNRGGRPIRYYISFSCPFFYCKRSTRQIFKVLLLELPVLLFHFISNGRKKEYIELQMRLDFEFIDKVQQFDTQQVWKWSYSDFSRTVLSLTVHLKYSHKSIDNCLLIYTNREKSFRRALKQRNFSESFRTVLKFYKIFLKLYPEATKICKQVSLTLVKHFPWLQNK